MILDVCAYLESGLVAEPKNMLLVIEFWLLCCADGENDEEWWVGGGVTTWIVHVATDKDSSPAA